MLGRRFVESDLNLEAASSSTDLENTQLLNYLYLRAPAFSPSALSSLPTPRALHGEGWACVHPAAANPDPRVCAEDALLCP